MAIRRSNRLYFFIAGYTLVFGFLASFGYVQVANVREAQKQEYEKQAHAKTFFSMPRMELTLSSYAGVAHHARIGLNLQIDQKNLSRFEDFQPRVSDRIINFLNHQDIEELRNPNQMYDLRHSLLYEINAASGPVPVSDVIFREFVVH